MPTLTDGSWLPAEDVKRHLGVSAGASAEELASVETARKAAATYVEKQRPDLLTLVGDVETYVPTPDVFEGALLVAARLHARKGSPAGLASFGEFGPAAVLRFDSDVERLLSIGRYAPPRIG